MSELLSDRISYKGNFVLFLCWTQTVCRMSRVDLRTLNLSCSNQASYSVTTMFRQSWKRLKALSEWWIDLPHITIKRTSNVFRGFEKKAEIKSLIPLFWNSYTKRFSKKNLPLNKGSTFVFIITAYVNCKLFKCNLTCHFSCAPCNCKYFM